MLCDQASDTINSKIITSHEPLVFFLNRIDRLSMPRGQINPAHYSG